MRGKNTQRALLLFGTLVLAAWAPSASATAAIVPAPAWAPIAVAGPTNLPPGGTGTIAVFTQNIGGISSAGTITIIDELPVGITTSASATGKGGWICTPTGAGQSTVSCETNEVVDAGQVPTTIKIPVSIDAGAETAVNKVTVSGGGAAAASFEAPITISPTPAKPGVVAFTGATYNADGTPTAQAASHPYAGSSAVFVNTVRAPNGAIVPAGDPKTIEVTLPPGLIGSPVATPRCKEGLNDGECPISTQVGLVAPIFGVFGEDGEPDPVHAVEAPIGYPAKFTFSVGGNIQQVNVVASLRSDEDYGVALTSPNTGQVATIYGAFFSLWGAPADPSHDGERCAVIPNHNNCGPSTAANTAFVTMPSDCALQAIQPPVFTSIFDTWLTIGQFESQQFPIAPVTGCDQLHFEAAFSLQPGVHSAATPSAFQAELNLPQGGLLDPELLAAPPLKRSVITFPPGVSLNPAAANGLATCSTEQIGLRHPKPPATEFPAPNRIRFDKTPARCPEASKVGTVEIETALLENPLHGSLYLAAEHDNPFNSLLATYIVVEDPATGIVVKLPAEMRADPVTGQLSAIVDDAPQTAFGHLKLDIRGGTRAPLATPDTCGLATTVGEFTPWSAPESGADTFTSDSFSVSSGPGGGACAISKATRPFAPIFRASTASAAADTYSPLQFSLTRKDGEQELKGVSITLPAGLTGKIAGIGTCSATQIAAAEAKSGRAEQASPSCPASSELGTIASTAGIGPDPIGVGGKLYLSTPYKGAPLSAVAIVPAVAGPYDLGNVVSRAAIRIDPVTAQLRATTDPIPDTLQGIGLNLRSLRVSLDRPGFTITPTSCNPMAITAKLTGAQAEREVAAPFQVKGCDALAFKPKFSAKLSGGTARNDHPSLRTELTYPPGLGYANTAFAQVALPHSEFLDQGHIDTVCTRVQFAADACPAGSIYGHAEATTPLLDEPLTGNVYLRSSSNKLPDLVIALKGPPSRPIEVVVDGRLDSIHGGIRTTIEGVPDAPVSKFVLTFKGGNKGLLVNSRNLCTAKRKSRLTVRLVGQNSKRADQSPVLGNDCAKKRRHRRH